ncbi:MAG: nucleotidyl transferase AbiEii/AbiGii toxin family protein [Chthoniobacteraceae bacterium]
MDILFTNRATFSSLYTGSVLLKRSPIEFRVPSLLHLIALKLHAMRNQPEREARDLPDILELLRLHPEELSAGDLRALCDRYSTPSMAEKILSMLP